MKCFPLFIVFCFSLYSTLAGRLFDDFDDQTINGSIWKVDHPFASSQVNEQDGRAILIQRGILETKQEFADSLEIRGRFRFTGNNDSFRIVFRSDLSVFPQFQERSGMIVILEQSGGIGLHGVNQPGGMTAPFSFETGRDYNLKIADNGKLAQLFLENMPSPILTLETRHRTGNKVAFYNREISGTRLEIDYLEVIETASPGLSAGLVAYYKLDGDAKDSSSRKGDGTVVNATFGTNRFGQALKALVVGKPHSGVQAPGDGLPLGKEARTLSFWLRPDSLVHRMPAVVYYGPGNTIRHSFGLGYEVDAKPFFWTPGAGAILGESTWKVGVWQHMTLVYRSDAFIEYFVDGEFLGRYPIDNTPTSIDTKLGPLIFGWWELDPPTRFTTQFVGAYDDLRIYNRPFSQVEVKFLYDFENRLSTFTRATATAQVVNGFVVGIDVTDGGRGYIVVPKVRILAPNGSGAEALAIIVDGVVQRIDVINPGAGYTGTITIEIDSPPIPPRKATAIANVVNGFVVGFTIEDAGQGYTAPPTISITGGGGTGAIAMATVADGILIGITVLNPGSGYTGTPRVVIASPPSAPSLEIEVSRVNVKLKLVLEHRYQLQWSNDLVTWNNQGEVFVAQEESITMEFIVGETGQYFRINELP